MPLRWINRPTAQATPPLSDEPKIVLAAPGSITPLGSTLPGSTLPRRLTHALAAGSLLAVALRPARTAAPGAVSLAPDSAFNVTNLNPSGAGSLPQAVDAANAHPGPDVITFNPSLTGAIALTATLGISEAVSIQGPGPGKLSVSGGNSFRVFYLYTFAPAPFTTTISGLTIRDGLATSGGGGGILDSNADLTLDNVALISNTASVGAGVAVEAPSPAITNGLTVRNSLISGNLALAGGGIYVVQGLDGLVVQNTQILTNTAYYPGGGLFLNHLYGDLTIEDTTIAGNQSQVGGGMAVYSLYSNQAVIRRTTISDNKASYGGGITGYYLNVPVTIENTTISGNRGVQVGGGIYLYAANEVDIRNSTIVSNTSFALGGGLVAAHANVPIRNSIIAGNHAAIAPDITGTVSLSYDLVQITSTATITDGGGNLFGLDPMLAPLADNGGPTQTYLPLPGSPVIDAGDPAFAPPPSTDQRGDPRVIGGQIDMGAVEAPVAEIKVFLPITRR